MLLICISGGASGGANGGANGDVEVWMEVWMELWMELWIERQWSRHRGSAIISRHCLVAVIDKRVGMYDAITTPRLQHQYPLMHPINASQSHRLLVISRGSYKQGRLGRVRRGQPAKTL